MFGLGALLGGAAGAAGGLGGAIQGAMGPIQGAAGAAGQALGLGGGMPPDLSGLEPMASASQGPALKPDGFTWDQWLESISPSEGPIESTGKPASDGKGFGLGDAAKAGQNLMSGLAGVANVHAQMPLPRNIGHAPAPVNRPANIGDQGLAGLIADASGRGFTSLRR